MEKAGTLENRSAGPRVAFCHVDNTRITHGVVCLTEPPVDCMEMIEVCLTIQSVKGHATAFLHHSESTRQVMQHSCMLVVQCGREVP